MDRKDEILNQLKSIIDPDLNQDIVSLGFIKKLEINDEGSVAFDLELTTPACPVKEQFRADCEKVLLELPWVTRVTVALKSSRAKSALTNAGKGLADVRFIIGVASCKGGVGKSTTAVNLAFSLAEKGATVGIFDADVYGPSLPTLIDVEFNGLYQKNQLIIPVEYQGVKLMSFAYASANTGGGPAIMRGPMVTQVINQLLTGTDWGELDYLVIDMPPGTGDTQLTLSQLIPMTAAVIVTTPQQLSFVDVVKGIQMFDKLKVPTIAVIENMSYFICDECDKRHNVFGTGSMRKLVEQFGFSNAFSLPIDADISNISDAGIPYVIEKPDSPITKIYKDITDSVIREVSKIAYSEERQPEVSLASENRISYRAGDSEIAYIDSSTLRLACRCAGCINEMTGEQIVESAAIPDDIAAEQVTPMGNYAVSVSWSDGHSSIYPYDMLTELMSTV